MALYLLQWEKFERFTKLFCKLLIISLNELKIPIDSKIVVNIAYGDYRKGIDIFSELGSKVIEESKKISMNKIENVVIFGDAKDYYYIAYLEDDEMKHGFILKSDYIKGNKKIIGAY